MEGTCGVCGIASVTLLRLTLSDAAGETDRVEFGLDALATEVNNHAV